MSSRSARHRTRRLAKIEQLESRLLLDAVELNLVVSAGSNGSGTFTVYADDNSADGGALSGNTNIGLASFAISVVGSSNVTVSDTIERAPAGSYNFSSGSGQCGFGFFKSDGLGSGPGGDGIDMYAAQATTTSPPEGYAFRDFGISSGSDASPPSGITIDGYAPRRDITWTQTSLGVEIATGDYSITGSSGTLTVFGDDGANSGSNQAHEDNTGTIQVLPAGWSEGQGVEYATAVPSQVTLSAPSITSAASDSVSVGKSGSFTVTTSGSPTPGLSEVGALPNGVTFTDNGDGTATLSGDPQSGTGGTYAITFTASNGILPAGTQSFVLTVESSPSITSANSATFTAGSTGSFLVTTANFPAATLSESGNLPGGVTFTNNGDGTATIAGTPAADAGGTYVLTLTAKNGNPPPGTQTFTLTVDGTPSITSAASDSFSVGKSGSFTVTTSGLPTPGLSEVGALPNGVTFSDNGNGTATLSGDPQSGTGGTYVLTLTASNGILPAGTQSFVLTVDSSPSITSANSATFTAGSTGSFLVTTANFPAATLSESGNLPAGVTFTNNGDGTATIAGIPAADAGGIYILTLTAKNGNPPPGTQTFALTVDDAPTITSGNSFTFAPNATGSFAITSSGFPVASLNETGTLPAGITFTDNGNGTATLAGATTIAAAGTYDLTFTATNGISPDAMQSVTLIVNQGGTVSLDDNGLLTLTGTPAADFGNITEANGTMTVLFDGETQTYSASSVTGINISLGAGNDSINLGSPDLPPATVAGGQGNDTIATVASNDLLKGGAGDDLFLNGAGSLDTINGGVGLNFAQNNPGDSMQNIFQLIDPPKAADTVITAPPAPATVTATVVNSVLQIFGTTGNDTISAALNNKATKIQVNADGAFVGAFSLSGLLGLSIAGKGGGDTLTVSSAITLPATLKGGGGNDSLIGGGGDNVLIGGAGNDTLVGGGGLNLLIPQAFEAYSSAPNGNDSLFGGGGTNIADFSYRSDPLTLTNNGQANSGDTADGEATTIASNITEIWGGTANDTIVGTVPSELLSGGAGADTIQGGGAGDTLVGGKGKDTVAAAGEPVMLYLADGKADEYSGINNPSEDVLDLDAGLDTVLS